MRETAEGWRPGAAIRDARYGWGIVRGATPIATGTLIEAAFGAGQRLLVVPRTFQAGPAPGRRTGRWRT